MCSPPGVPNIKLQPSSFEAFSCIVVVKINVLWGTVDRPLHPSLTTKAREAFVNKQLCSEYTRIVGTKLRLARSRNHAERHIDADPLPNREFSTPRKAVFLSNLTD
ncbi:hypothetical protein Osc7112_4590 [Oscillatoria nigro-viridis PCC 7112]|uniref:Uncharacterized protein n=1 Tax=Phormidium nigroviride PCC 7112 TaxID=179408 RepID=K9VMV5_9CYAN|nr:hypothetical protein [Oscillatoria nigro-viridis]AFZ08884.1 hypothetical protein Osc7112_4590 [Oscillatoria nigro-viridis PCC 7112]